MIKKIFCLILILAMIMPINVYAVENSNVYEDGGDEDYDWESDDDGWNGSVRASSEVTNVTTSLPSDWAVNEVNAAINTGIVMDSVRENYIANITREQFCEMVVRAYEKISGKSASTGTESFNDTKNSEILKAANLGIVSGYGNGTFGPDDLITREQIAAMLVRMIDKAVSYVNTNVYNDNWFADLSSISDWALPSVNFAYDKKIMQGVGNNKIAPSDHTTCEQAVLLAYRTVEKYYNESAKLDSVYELTSEHIAFDNKTDIRYTDNIILAFIKGGLDDKDKEEIANIANGEIVAQLSGAINLLQIEVEDCTLDELNDLSRLLISSNNVYHATPDVLIGRESIMNNLSDNGDSGRGSYSGEDDWWVDAIDAKYVWNQYDMFIGTESVGVIDSEVVANHEDLANKISFITSGSKEYNDTQVNELKGLFKNKKSHGTSVSSIITANRNHIGITGVAYKSDIVFANRDYIINEQAMSTTNIFYLIDELIEARIKTINISQGFSKLNQNEVKEIAKATADVMCQLIVQDKDFLIVESAGNDSTDATNNGLFSSITIDNCNDILQNYNVRFEDLKNKIIIVGATTNKSDSNGNYAMRKNSNYGVNVDICAPGENIRTCSGLNNQYSEESGTSGSAPMVSGTAAILWGIDPTLTAAEVKDYIIKGAKHNAIGVGKDKGNEYPMLNVRGAVEQLIHPYSIAVRDKETNEPINGALVEYYNGLFESNDIMGIYELQLPDGKYTINVSKDGYKSVSEEIEFLNYFANEFNDVHVIYLEKDKNEYISYNSAKKFNIVAEYNGQVYSGLENGNSIHVGNNGEKTKFCIDNGYTYYYTFDSSLSLSMYHSQNTTFYREKIDGSERTVLFTIKGNNYSLSDVYLYNDAIYFSCNYFNDDYSVLQYYDLNSETLEDVLDSRESEYVLLLCADNGYLYISGEFGGVARYDINSGSVDESIINAYLDGLMIDDDNIYCVIREDTHKYDFDNSKDSVIKNVRLSCVHDGKGYYTDDGNIYEIDLNSFKSNEILKRYGHHYYNEVYYVSNYYIYTTDSGQTDDQLLFRIDKVTGNSELIGISYADYQ